MGLQATINERKKKKKNISEIFRSFVINYTIKSNNHLLRSEITSRVYVNNSGDFMAARIMLQALASSVF